ncbi:MAG: hypothetical protein KIS85_05010 [Anaerolineales bacterium]|nr:hypothetical protein [Anaerolineales bacterium]
MNRHDLALLQQMRGYPAVTITLPTHRTSPENKQDPVRLRNLIGQASERLLSEVSKREADPLLARLTALGEEVDFINAQDGLVLFANQDFARMVYLPFTLKERVVVDETFFTRDLVFALNRTPRYWVLSLSEKPTRLYEGSKQELVEIKEDGFPMTHTGPGGEASLPGGYGVSRSAHRDERHRQFFRQVDAALKTFLADDPLPLAVVGVDRFQAFFNEVSQHKDAVVATLTGNHDKTSPHELAKLVWPLVKEGLAKEREKIFAELEKAVGERRVTSTIGEVWRKAVDGRGHILVVEEDFHYPAVLDESGRHLKAADDPQAPGVIDDAVDDVIEEVLRNQGRVVFVDNGTLDVHQRIALILRY